MKIVVLMGSPNKKGSTAILVDNFKRGAEESGHAVDVIDVCHADVNPCIGCGTPSMTVHSRYPQEAYQLGKSLSSF